MLFEQNGTLGGETLTWHKPSWQGAMGLVWVYHYGNGAIYEKETKKVTPLATSRVTVRFSDADTTNTPVKVIKVADKWRKPTLNRGR